MTLDEIDDLVFVGTKQLSAIDYAIANDDELTWDLAPSPDGPAPDLLV